MKTEIKVRAWDPEAEHMVYSDNEADYENYSFEFHYGTGELACYAFPPMDEYNPEESFDSVRLDNIMLFTGLKDKNGKEVYGGDILRYTLNFDTGDFVIGECVINPINLIGVYFDTGDTHCIDIERYWIIDDCDCSNQLEVIGNIYETPELIK